MDPRFQPSYPKVVLFDDHTPVKGVLWTLSKAAAMVYICSRLSSLRTVGCSNPSHDSADIGRETGSDSSPVKYMY